MPRKRFSRTRVSALTLPVASRSFRPFSEGGSGPFFLPGIRSAKSPHRGIRLSGVRLAQEFYFDMKKHWLIGGLAGVFGLAGLAFVQARDAQEAAARDPLWCNEQAVRQAMGEVAGIVWHCLISRGIAPQYQTPAALN